MLEQTRALFADLATALAIPALMPDANGGIQLSIGADNNVILFGENDITLLVVVPVAAVPKTPDYGTVTWLLGRNFYTSDLAPFRIACDESGTLVIWGRIPVEGLTGTQLAAVIDAVAAEAGRIREAVAED
jgi:hypothetical protein